MTRTFHTPSKRHLPAKLAAGLALSAFLMLGTFVIPASAEQQAGQDNTSMRNRDRSNRVLRQSQERSERDQRYYGGDDRGYYYGSRSYYGTPYAPPPVDFGPGININLW